MFSSSTATPSKSRYASLARRTVKVALLLSTAASGPLLKPQTCSKWTHVIPVLCEDDLARHIKESSRTVAFTGAGVSQASGVPTSSSSNSCVQTECVVPEYAVLKNIKKNPSPLWESLRRFKKKIYKPNPAHYALATLQKTGKIGPIFTQNYDGLHQEAGAQNVVELHGNVNKSSCTHCHTTMPTSAALKLTQTVRRGRGSLPRGAPQCPKCETGILLPQVVFFGQSVNNELLRYAQAHAKNAMLYLVIGYNGDIGPTNKLPCIAKESGAKVLDVNIRPSKYTTRGIADGFIPMKAENLKRIVEKLGLKCVDTRSGKKT